MRDAFQNEKEGDDEREGGRKEEVNEEGERAGP